VSEPAHIHCQSSLQSMWAVRRYLSRYPVAGVAFGAPGTCKQHTPHTTAICGGAVLFICWHPHQRFSPTNSMSVRTTTVCSGYDQSASPAHRWWLSSGRGPATQHGWGTRKDCHEGVPMPPEERTCGEAMIQTYAQRHNQRLFGQSISRRQRPWRRLKTTKVPKRRMRCNGGGNLQTKLARRCAGVAYLWLGYPGRGSGSGQPDSPPQSPEPPCDRWARGDSHRWRVTSHRWRALLEVSATMSGGRVRLDRSIPTLQQSRLLCQAAVARFVQIIFSR
jgi:hypothetical protein